MLSLKPWTSEAALLLGTALMGCLLFFSLVGLAVYHLFGNEAPAWLPYWNFLSSTLGFHTASLVLLHFFLRRHRVSWSEFLGGNRRCQWRAVAQGLAVGLVVLVPAWQLQKFSLWIMNEMGFSPEEQGPIQVLRGIRHWVQYGWFALSVVGLAPLVEEALFRGVLYPFLKQRIQPFGAVALTSILFAAIHGSVPTLLPLTFLALVLIWIYEKTDNLLAPIAAHAVFNLVNFLQLLRQNIGSPGVF